MARRIEVTITCDRCGTETPPAHGNDACMEHGLVVALEGGEGAAFNGSVTGTLCSHCVDEFKAWLHAKGGSFSGTLQLGPIEAAHGTWPNKAWDTAPGATTIIEGR